MGGPRKLIAGRYEMTTAAKRIWTLLWGVPKGQRSPKGRSVGTGPSFSLFKWRPTSLRKPGKNIPRQ